MNVRAVIVLLVLAGLAGPLHADEAGFLTCMTSGNDHAAWLVRTGKDGASFDVFARKIGKSWQPVERGRGGRPVIVQAVGQTLHVIYQGGQYSIMALDGSNINARNAPGEVLAVCEAVDFAGHKSPALLAMVRRKTPPESPSPATRPAVAATTVPADGAYNCLYRGSAGGWEPLHHEQVRSPSRCSLAVLDGKLYELSLSGETSRPRLRRYDGPTGWTAPAAGDLPKFDPQQAVMLAVAGQLRLISPAGESSLEIFSFAPAEGKFTAPQPILRDEKPLAWPRGAMPEITRLGDQLALLWTQDGRINFALCSPAGAMRGDQNVTDALRGLSETDMVRKLSGAFLWGVVIVVGLAMVFLRPRTGPKPFTLPDGMKAGSLLRRAAAAAVDFIPFSVLGSAIFAPPMSAEQLKQLLINRQAVPPEGIMYGAIFSLGLYVLYCIVMELRFGATAGKMLLRLRVVSDDGKRARFREVILRNLMKIIELSMLGSPMPWFLGVLILVPLLTQYRQRLGDMLARSAVVNSTPPTPDQTNTPPPEKTD